MTNLGARLNQWLINVFGGPGHFYLSALHPRFKTNKHANLEFRGLWSLGMNILGSFENIRRR